MIAKLLVFTMTSIAGFTLATSTTYGAEKADKLDKGISAWCYNYSKEVVQQVKLFNGKAKPQLRFKYFFPYAGSLDFNPAERRASLTYNPADLSEKYAGELPDGTLIMPIIDARADKKEFSGWKDEEYRQVALLAANAIIKDDTAAGVQIDIEPFQLGHLPFYKHLREALNQKGKYATMFVGMRSEKDMEKVFDCCDILVLSGYDLNGDGHPPEKFKAIFSQAVKDLDKIAKKKKGKYMVGIPAAASWGEWEYVVDGQGQNRKDSGFKQEEYVKICLEVLKQYHDSPEFLGVSLWQMSSVGEKDEPEKVKKKTKFPNYIRPSVWNMLEDY